MQLVSNASVTTELHLAKNLKQDPDYYKEINVSVLFICYSEMFSSILARSG